MRTENVADETGMYTVYAIVEDGSEDCVFQCATLAEAAEHLHDMVQDDAMFVEPLEEGEDEPKAYSPTAPPCYGIKFNMGAAWSVIEALQKCGLSTQG